MCDSKFQARAQGQKNGFGQREEFDQFAIDPEAQGNLVLHGHEMNVTGVALDSLHEDGIGEPDDRRILCKGFGLEIVQRVQVGCERGCVVFREFFQQTPSTFIRALDLRTVQGIHQNAQILMRGDHGLDINLLLGCNPVQAGDVRGVQYRHAQQAVVEFNGGQLVLSGDVFRNKFG